MAVSPTPNATKMRRDCDHNDSHAMSDLKQTLTTTQHDSMDEIVEATKHMEPGFNARIKQDPRYSSIRLGDSDYNQVQQRKFKGRSI